jgi:hypothetical protein
MEINWTETTEERFDEMLGCLPPAIMYRGGFLVGEPFDHRVCTIGKAYAPTFTAFTKVGDRYFEAVECLTVAEFKAVDPAAAAAAATPLEAV